MPKTINNSKDLTDFLLSFYSVLKSNGFVTQGVQNFINSLGNTDKTINEDFLTKIGEGLVNLMKDTKNTLQSYFVIANILRVFDIPGNYVECISRIILSNLKSIYTSNQLSKNEYDIDMRAAAWSVLTESVKNLNKDLKQQIAQLALKTGDIDNEEEIVQIQAVQLGVTLSKE
jgi:mRNA-degrading endonuclease HigB of HigAB toxin-antitoxin module